MGKRHRPANVRKVATRRLKLRQLKHPSEAPAPGSTATQTVFFSCVKAQFPGDAQRPSRVRPLVFTVTLIALAGRWWQPQGEWGLGGWWHNPPFLTDALTLPPFPPPTVMLSRSQRTLHTTPSTQFQAHTSRPNGFGKFVPNTTSNLFVVRIFPSSRSRCREFIPLPTDEDTI